MRMSLGLRILDCASSDYPIIHVGQIKWILLRYLLTNKIMARLLANLLILVVHASILLHNESSLGLLGTRKLSLMLLKVFRSLVLTYSGSNRVQRLAMSITSLFL